MRKELSPKALSLKRQYGLCLSTLFASFLIGLAVSVILDMPIGLILTESSIMSDSSMSTDSIRTIADGCLGIIGALITIFVKSYTEAYFNNRFVFKGILLAVVLTFITQVIINLILGHSVWFSGPTVYFARYVFEAKHFDIIGTMGAKKILENYQWLFMIIAFWFLYAPVMIFGKYLGTKKSKKNFKEHISEVNKNDES